MLEREGHWAQHTVPWPQSYMQTADADMHHMVGDGGGRLAQGHRLRVSAVNILVRTLIGMKLFHVQIHPHPMREAPYHNLRK